MPRHVIWPVARLVVDYFAYAARPGASARCAARRRLLHVRCASGCLGTLSGSSSTTSPRAGSSSTTSPTPRVWVPWHVARLVSEGPIWRTREGGSEWEPIKILLKGDGNSNKMNTASNTHLRLTTQIGQAHVATGVPLDLGTNTQPSNLRTQRNTKPRVYRPTPVRPVSTTGQTSPCW
jgi:hypothetical protein